MLKGSKFSLRTSWWWWRTKQIKRNMMQSIAATRMILISYLINSCKRGSKKSMVGRLWLNRWINTVNLMRHLNQFWSRSSRIRGAKNCFRVFQTWIQRPSVTLYRITFHQKITKNFSQGLPQLGISLISWLWVTSINTSTPKSPLMMISSFLLPRISTFSTITYRQIYLEVIIAARCILSNAMRIHWTKKSLLRRRGRKIRRRRGRGRRKRLCSLRITTRTMKKSPPIKKSLIKIQFRSILSR